MSGETMRSRNPAGRAGFVNNLLAFVSTLAVFIESRLALFSKESKAAFVQLMGLLACLVGALLFFSLGYAFLIIGAIAGIAHLLQLSWLWGRTRGSGSAFRAGDNSSNRCARLHAPRAVSRAQCGTEKGP